MTATWDRATLFICALAACADKEYAALDEYYAGVVDEVHYNALPLARRIEANAESYWQDFEDRAIRGYENYMMDTRLAPAMALAVALELKWARAPKEMTSAEHQQQRDVAGQLDKHRAQYRQQRESELRSEVVAWERAALARLGKHTVTASEAPAATLAA